MLRKLILALLVGCAIVFVNASPERRARVLGWVGLARDVCANDVATCRDVAPGMIERALDGR